MEGPIHVAIKIRKPKYIFVSYGDCKQFVFRTTYRCVARNMFPAGYGLRDHPQTIVHVVVVGSVWPYFITALVLSRRLLWLILQLSNILPCTAETLAGHFEVAVDPPEKCGTLVTPWTTITAWVPIVLTVTDKCLQQLHLSVVPLLPQHSLRPVLPFSDHCF